MLVFESVLDERLPRVFRTFSGRSLGFLLINLRGSLPSVSMFDFGVLEGIRSAKSILEDGGICRDRARPLTEPSRPWFRNSVGEIRRECATSLKGLCLTKRRGCG
jgi:hypothetical protein